MGLVSSSGNSTTGNSTSTRQPNDDANATASASKRKHSIIIGVSVPLASLVLIGLGIAAFFWMRRYRQLKREEAANFTPHQFVEVEREPGRAFSIIPDLEPPRRTGPSGKATLVAAGASQASTLHQTIDSLAIHSEGSSRGDMFVICCGFVVGSK